MRQPGRQGVWDAVTRVYSVLPPARKRELVLLLVLILVGGIAEVATVGAVLPFLVLLTDTSQAERLAWLSEGFALLGADSFQDRLTLATALLCAAAVASGVTRVLILRKTQGFAFSFGHDLLVEVQRRALLQPYSWHVEHNSAEQLATITKVEVVTYAVLLQLMQATAAVLLAAFIALLLLQLAPIPVAAAALALCATYLAIAAFARARLVSHSATMSQSFENRIRTVQESFGGIRDLILDGSRERALEEFEAVNRKLSAARADSAFLTAVPRPLVEAAGVIVIALVTLVLAGRPGGLTAALPILGALALAAQRLLPLVQQFYVAWSSISSHTHLFEDISERLNLPIQSEPRPQKPLSFERCIEFQDVSYAYPSRDRPAVHGLSFTVPKGSRVALLGPSGSGKSTTADLLMGLIAEGKGAIRVDGLALTEKNRPAWQANIAHVPQRVFLADATIAQNVALSVEIDRDRLRKAIADAQLEDFVDTLPAGYETRIGEKGARLSGGQQQRLAIARAIYRQRSVLVLDEATSALDDRSEAAVLAALDKLQDRGCTIIVIAHRGGATAGCDMVLELRNGRIAREVELSDQRSHRGET